MCFVLQKCHTQVDWIYGPLTNKKISYSHFDTTRNLKDSFFLFGWARRLYHILVFLEQLSEEKSLIGSMNLKVNGRQRDLQRNRKQLDLRRESITRNMEMDALVSRTSTLARNRISGVFYFNLLIWLQSFNNSNSRRTPRRRLWSCWNLSFCALEHKAMNLCKRIGFFPRFEFACAAALGNCKSIHTGFDSLPPKLSLPRRQLIGKHRVLCVLQKWYVIDFETEQST